jgi:hypothetical protein
MMGMVTLAKTSRFCGKSACMILVTALGLSCAKGVPVRTPECNAKVNRCMEQCGNTPTSQEPKNMAVSGKESIVGSSCELSCNRC